MISFFRCLVVLLLISSFSVVHSFYEIGYYEPITEANADEVKLIHQLPFENIGAGVLALAFNPQISSELALAQENGVIALWNVETAERTATWQASTMPVTAVAYTPEPGHVVTASEDGLVQLWDTVTTQSVRAFQIEGEIPLVLDTAKNDVLAVGYQDGTVRLWDIHSGELLAEIYGYNGRIIAIDLTTAGTYLAFGSPSGYGGMVFVYNVENLANGDIYLEATFEAGELNSLMFHPDPNLHSYYGNINYIGSIGIATVSNHSGAINFWDVLAPFEARDWGSNAVMSYPDALSFNHNGNLVAIVGKATTAGGSCMIGSESNICPVMIFHTKSVEYKEGYGSRVLNTLDGHNGWPSDVAFSSDDRFIATSSSMGEVYIWGVYPG
jgi:WD40 repeat protein